MNTQLATLTLMLASPLAAAQTMTQADALTRLFSASEVRQEWFAPSFLAQIPFATIQAQLGGIAQAYGAFQKLDAYQSKPLVIFERGTLLVTSALLDEQGRFTSFGAIPGPTGEALTDPQQQQGKTVLEKLLTTDPLDTAMFSPDFLQAVPADQLTSLMAKTREGLGAFKNVTPQPDGWRANFERGRFLVTQLRLDQDGKITSFRFQPPVRAFTTLNEAKTAFTSLPGDVSMYVAEVGQAPLLSLKAARPMAVGSTFKLAILSALQAQIKSGKAKWTDELTLTDAVKSLPSGTLQDAPAGNKYTLQDLATRMIRDSDNTATDLLLQAVGREAVEERLGQRAMPSTREAFALKNPANLALLRAYRAAGLNTAARRDVLRQASTAPLPPAAAFAQGTTLARDVEWFVSTERLCHLMSDVAALSATQVNPGVVNKNDYASVSYKGGSEPGVLNLTTQVTTKGGKTYCVSASWNRPEPLDESAFFSLYLGLMSALP